MRLINLKTILSSAVVATMLTGCAQKTGNQTYDQNQNAIIGTTIGALAGIVLGNNIGGGNKGRNKVIGAVAGAAVGGGGGVHLLQWLARRRGVDRADQRDGFNR